MAKGFFLAVFCGILFLILHVIIFHNFRIKRRFRALLIIWTGLLVPYSLLFPLIPEDIFLRITESFFSLGIINFFYGIIIYVLWLLFYLQLISFVDRSITTRIMIEIENSSGKKLTLTQIKQIYDLNKKVSDEIEDMIHIKYLIADNGYFKNSYRGKIHARIMKFLGGYLKLGDAS